MEKNKTGKYLKYAIGEIVLVVIGILIAVSINNWNEGQKKQQQKVFYLSNLQENLKQDTLTLNLNIIQLKNKVKYLKRLSIDLKKISQDSLNFMLVNTLLTTNGFGSETTTWENLQSTGKIDIIKNQALVDSLYIYHNFNENSMRIWMESDQAYSRQNIAPFLMRNFELDYNVPHDSRLIFEPINQDLSSLENFNNQMHYRNAMRYKNNVAITMIDIFEFQKNRASHILKLIEEDQNINR